MRTPLEGCRGWLVCLVLSVACAGVACAGARDNDKSPAPVPTSEDTRAPTSGAVADSTPRRPAEDFERHAQKVRERIAKLAPKSTFHVVVERPFVVIGDEPAATVRRRASRTVRWSVQRLQEAYFPREPDDIIEIWLFGDANSYMRNAKRFFNDTPDTPYGYYSPSHRALIMNIATGGGTLIHEIVHPFMRSNFRACPAWFNEGMGSLYEQASERDGDIIGLTNWRLAGLQDALRANRVPSFETLMATTDEEFYEQDPGSNYAQARYLMYYLQEKGLLHDYYRQYVANAASDPTGYQTLQKILQEDDMDAFFATWKRYVLGLEFRR